MRTTPFEALGGSSAGDFYVDTVTSFGSTVLNAHETTAVHQTMVDRAQTMRASANGVNVDEEMVQLIAQQQAFAAATRLVNIANEMVEDILRMV